MLDELAVTNLGVLRAARLDPHEGLTVITGETGAGKTLLLGALRLLLGESADDGLVGPFGEDAQVEGRFVRRDGAEVGAARRLTRGGRSRAYLDGAIASAAALESATEGAAEIIGQHDQLSLTRSAAVRDAIDRMLDEHGSSARAAYQKQWHLLSAHLKDRDRLGGDRTALERERDMLRHQVEEIERAAFQPGDDAELSGRLARLRNADTLRLHLASTAEAVDDGRAALGRAVAELRKASSVDHALEDVLGDLEDMESRLGERAVDVAKSIAGLEADPDELELAEQRWATLADLRRRYGPELAEVLAYAEDGRRRLDELDGLLARADTLDEEIREAETELDRFGAALLEARRQAGKRLATAAEEHLRHLGFSDPVVQADVSAAEPTASGADSPALAFASDRRLRVGEIGKVASGGELSRLVLSIRLAGGAADADTLVFDEIDAGVGGAVALEMGRKLAMLARSRQVLCVSHLPQIAAFADRHYVVDRSETEATVRRVEGDERRQELARMLAGLPDSERGQQAADELLAVASGG